MKIFITGGSGFLGKVATKKLMAGGHDVWSLARSEKSKSEIQETGAIPIDGDLSNLDRLRPMLLQMDTVVHCAAPVEFWGPWAKFNEGIVEATIMLAQAANECGVKRFIHMSSESVIQDCGSLLDIDETYPFPDEPNSYYGKAKMLAEQRLLKADFKMEVVILRPTFIWGANCPALRTVESKVRAGKFVWVNNGRSEFEAVHVDNVASAILLSITKGKNKGVYFITDGQRTTVRDFFTKLIESRGLAVPTSSIPGWIAYPLAGFCEAIWKGFGISGVPPLSKFDVAFVSQPRRYNIQRATLDLGYRPVVSADSTSFLCQGEGGA